MNAKAAARSAIDAARDELIEISHRIHANPELGYNERQACEWLSESARNHGLAVETPYCDLATSFIAKAGSGPLHIAVCAEYDALPGIGHACGHNIIATTALGAGIGLAGLADEIGATVSVIGTPAEEGGGGKIRLLESGGFDGVHAAMMVHPAPVDMLLPSILAAQRLDVRYTGKAAHASAFPELGINAADALTVAQVAIGLMRQHLRSTDRVHGITTKGGDAANIIPEHTAAHYSIRARTIGELDEVRAKIIDCFEAGAVATGAKLDVSGSDWAYSEMRHDPDMAAAYGRNSEELGRTFPDLGPQGSAAGSTDMGNVSLRIPSIHPMIGIDSLPAVNHQPEFTAHCNTPAADKAVMDGAIALAWTAIDCATDEKLRARLLG